MAISELFGNEVNKGIAHAMTKTEPVNPPERFNVLGVMVSATTMAMTVEYIRASVRTRLRTYVCVSGVHGIMESHRDPGLRSIHNAAGLVTPDGMPLVWLAKFADRRIERVYGPDLLLAVCQACQPDGTRHFFYGGGPGVASLLASRLQGRFQKIRIVGTLCPPFKNLSPQEDQAEIERINAANPDLVWVGLSTPKQERWMASHRDHLSAPVLLGVGAAFDFHAGLKRQAPLWMQRSGLEWAFRLATEPRRLWKRYLRNNPLFLYHSVLQLTGLRTYDQ